MDWHSYVTITCQCSCQMNCGRWEAQGERHGPVVVQHAFRSWTSETRLPLKLPSPQQGSSAPSAVQLAANTSRLKELQSLQVRLFG